MLTFDNLSNRAHGQIISDWRDFPAFDAHWLTHSVHNVFHRPIDRQGTEKARQITRSDIHINDGVSNAVPEM
jgi:hypothetical protein